MSVAFIAAILVTPGSVAVGPAVFGFGSADHTVYQNGTEITCISGSFVTVEIDLLTGSGAIQSSSECVFFPDQYLPGDCIGDPSVYIRCAWVGDAVASLLEIQPNGAFSYSFDYGSGSHETLSGYLTLA